ncbi:MAG: cell envelope integrity protein CreD [Bacteroidetes bacterium]|nr:cell envelope integrity protein CreD [Bacteroidota bacterium]
MPDNNKTFFERLNAWIRNSITLKLVSIGILILLLLIPAFMIEDLIRNREYTSSDAIEEVSSKWGEAQTISGPVLAVPYKKYYKKDKDIVEVIEYAHFLPDELKISGKVDPEYRHRGIFEVVVYTSKLHIEGKFSQPSFSGWPVDTNLILWKDAFVYTGISDMRGINENIALNWSAGQVNDHLLFNPGTGIKPSTSYDESGSGNMISETGVSTRVNLGTPDDTGKLFQFSFELSLNGSKKLFFSPLGKETNVTLESPWPDPGFDGAFLPDERTVSEKGFSAKWKVLHLNRNYPQQWLGTEYRISESTFGVNLLVPVDHYQKSTRAAKYAVLIITLTFLVFFFVEILNKQRIHPFQYILVGLAICIFYTLLISISEHLSFNLAYFISGVAVIAAITAYSLSMFTSKLPTILLGLIMVAIYGFIFIIIQLQDYALLTGSIGLFLVLLVVMYISRKINWYSAAE